MPQKVPTWVVKSSHNPPVPTLPRCGGGGQMSYETSMVGGGTGGVREPIHAPILLILTDQHLAPVDKPKLSPGNGGGVCERGERGCGWRLGSG